jgi:hypothetical protein
MIKSFFLAIVLFSFSFSFGQSLITDDPAVEDSIKVLLQDWDLAEANLEQIVETQSADLTAADRKVRLKGIYEARLSLAKAEHAYYALCVNHAPDTDTQILFRKKSYAAKRQRDYYQSQVWVYTAAEIPTVKY